MWQVVIKIRRQKTENKKVVLKTKNKTESRQKYKEPFSNLFSKLPQIAKDEITPKIKRQLPINTEAFTLEEINPCLKSFKSNKTPGPNKIPAKSAKLKRCQQSF